MLPALSHLAAGLRLALILFAAMSLLTLYRGPAADVLWERLKNRSWALLALSCVAYSPAHAIWLLGHRPPKALTLSLDALACGLACAGLINLLAARGLRRGLSAERVRKGVAVNVAILITVVGLAWLSR